MTVDKFVLTERLELHIIEIQKLERLIKENITILNKDLVSWIRFKYLSDRATMIETGIREGREQGIKEGKKEGKKEGERLKAIEIAKNMLKDKKDLKEIIKYTGLTEDEIKKL